MNLIFQNNCNSAFARIFKNHNHNEMKILWQLQVCHYNLTLKIILEKIRCTWANKKYDVFLDEIYINKKFIRQLERTRIKISRHIMFILFNETCLNKDILPKHKHTQNCFLEFNTQGEYNKFVY